MKRYVLMSVLLVSMFACPAVLSQEFEPEDMEIQMEMKEREMELQQLDTKMAMEREMQNLELEQRRMELERAREDLDVDDDDDDDDCGGGLALLLLICVIVRILAAIWVYTDIRQLNRGSGIWIVIVLLAGLLGALVYAVVRLGDSRQKGS
ncbi:MAG: hypothetical protein WBC05_17950 [Sedimentisphaerales bacterium]